MGRSAPEETVETGAKAGVPGDGLRLCVEPGMLHSADTSLVMPRL